jgi:hypothetical protein
MPESVPTQTKEIKTVDIVTSLNPTDYILAIQNGKLVKIKVSDLKKIV